MTAKHSFVPFRLPFATFPGKLNFHSALPLSNRSIWVGEADWETGKKLKRKR